MREPPWLQRREESPEASLALLPLRAASWLYAAGARVNRELHTRGLLAARRLPCRVVSVGSLMVGGSGKTPTAAYVAAGLHARGHRVALATRGRGVRGSDRVRVLSDGRQLHSAPARSGDEPLVLARHAPGVPVLVARDRGLAGLRAIGGFDADVLVLDDGFQHHRLQRDVEILTFDAGQGLGNGFVLPRGPLREGVSALRRADAIGVIDGELTGDEEALMTSLAGDARRYRAIRRPTRLRPLDGGAPRHPDVLGGLRVGALAGIGRPDALVSTLRALGAEVVADRFLPDHHAYRADDLAGLREQASVWVTTEKDAVKIMPAWLGGLDLRVLTIELEIEEAEGFFDWLEERLLRSARGSSSRHR